VVDEDVRTRAPRRTRQVREDLGQLTEPQLGGSTTAAGVLGQTDRGACFGRQRHPGI
jgi:hypothetical protein